jgi:hypothetical protein
MDKVGFRQDMFLELSFGTHGDEIQIHSHRTSLFDFRSYLKSREVNFQRMLQQYPTLLAPPSLPQTVGQYLLFQGHLGVHILSRIKGVKKIPHLKLRQQLRRSLLTSNFAKVGRIMKFLRPRIPEYSRILRLRDMLKLMNAVEKLSSSPDAQHAKDTNKVREMVIKLRRYLKKHTETGVELVSASDGKLKHVPTRAVTMDALLAVSSPQEHTTGSRVEVGRILPSREVEENPCRERASDPEQNVQNNEAQLQQLRSHGGSIRQPCFEYSSKRAKTTIIAEIMREVSEGLRDEPPSLERLLGYFKVLRTELAHLGANPFAQV